VDVSDYRYVKSAPKTTSYICVIWNYSSIHPHLSLDFYYTNTAHMKPKVFNIMKIITRNEFRGIRYFTNTTAMNVYLTRERVKCVQH